MRVHPSSRVAFSHRVIAEIVVDEKLEKAEGERGPIWTLIELLRLAVLVLTRYPLGRNSLCLCSPGAWT